MVDGYRSRVDIPLLIRHRFYVSKTRVYAKQETSYIVLYGRNVQGAPYFGMYGDLYTAICYECSTEGL